jgi:hypothetical protein
MMPWNARVGISLILAMLQTFMLHVVGDHFLRSWRWGDPDLLGFVMWCTVAPLLSIVFYRIVPWLFGFRTWDGETRCRQCQYILRGISEPRCPECGERI